MCNLGKHSYRVVKDIWVPHLIADGKEIVTYLVMCSKCLDMKYLDQPEYHNNKREELDDSVLPGDNE